MDKVETLYINEFIKNGKLFSKFLCVHDDDFGREMTLQEIKEQINKTLLDYKVRVVSRNSQGKINVFYLELEGIYSGKYDKLPFEVQCFEDIKYYSIIPCDYNPKEV